MEQRINDYMSQYRNFLAIWQCINTMNNHGIYLYGYATCTDGNYKIEFSCDAEKDTFKAVFGNI